MQKYIPYEDLKMSMEAKVREIQAQDRYTLAKGTPESAATRDGTVLPANFTFKGAQPNRYRPYDRDSSQDRQYGQPPQGRGRGRGSNKYDAGNDDQSHNKGGRGNGGGRKDYHQNRRDYGRVAIITTVKPVISLAAQIKDPFDPIWMIDAGCTRHVTHQAEWFTASKPGEGTIIVGGKNEMPIEATGTVICKLPT
ncbi:TPA: hypothetical protein N0F65_005473 [Lagenidium giganteum]|uniref:Retrovirus-related Pol polyprotein from transposon TNT 1-94-like beta-barrel domain-containing protein n=1 Tax=Lagenidium giganteum TaxID=4803 RepID=A0AAV2YWI1_9STRA|nr:TPA: hypothetical protein N0F65_005473 [Lagenidium giganteum]